MFIVYRHAQVQVPRSRGSLVTVIKKTATETFQYRHVIILRYTK